MKKYLFYLLTLTFFITIIYSCDKSEGLEFEEKINPLTKEVASARNWYFQSSIENNHSLLEYTERLDWKNAVVTCSELQYIVEVPIITGERMSLTNSNQPEMNVVTRLIFFGRSNSYYASLAVISSNVNSKEFLSKTSNINYGYISDDFEGNVSVFDRKFIPLEDNLFVNGEKSVSNSRFKSEPAVCYIIWEIFSDGSREFVHSYCTRPGGGGSYGGGGSGGHDPSPEEDPLKWNNANSIAIDIKDCVDNNTTTRQNWFRATNGERIAHLIDAMRFEYKNLNNGGSDNYTPCFCWAGNHQW